MILFRPGSHVHRLVTLLSIVGEYPVRSLHLLGSERVYKALIHKLTKPDIIRNPQTGTEITGRILSVSGKAGYKSIRLYKAALPILAWIHPEALTQYLGAFWNHHFPGDMSHRDRNHRIAEASAMFFASGIEFRPYLLPELQNVTIASVIPTQTSFYPARSIKSIGSNEMNKTMFTRLVGAMFNPGNCYAVYNTRNSVMKWSGMGEFKTLHNLLEIGRMNAGVSRVDSAILFGESDDIALATLAATENSRRPEFRFDSIYRHIHYVPMNKFGVHLLRILSVPDWNEKLMGLLFDDAERSFNKSTFEYDAFINNKYIFSHLDGDIARLIRFKEAITGQDLSCEAICFPDQVPFLREYLGRLVSIKTIDMDSVESELCPEQEELYWMIKNEPL